MNRQKWLEIATSRDKSAHSLTEVYRDKTCLVATNGHALHLVTGLAEAEPQYLSGSEMQFPDYQQCIPESNKLVSIEISVPDPKTTKKMLGDLKKLAAIIKDGKYSKITLKIENNNLKIVADDHNFKATYTAPMIPQGGHLTLNSTLDLNLLVNALQALLITESSTFLINFDSTNELAPLIIEYLDNMKAIVMPMRR